MSRLFILLAIASALGGCANTLPTCEGKHRRPINDPARVDIVHASCGANV